VLAKGQLDPAILFGGDRDVPGHPLHACPGKHLAIGALMGILTALLDVGELKPSAALVTVLVPPAPPEPPPGQNTGMQRQTEAVSSHG